MRIFRRLKKRLKNYKWKKRNPHNRTYLGEIVERDDCITVGNASYGEINILATNPQYKLIIGNYCSIARKVMFILNADHETEFLSTFPIYTYINKENKDAKSKGDIIIKDDVWIGYNAIIMSGVTIGQGAIVGAGSIVTKNVPDYAVVVGNPSRIIKYRFDEETIKKLKKIDFSNITYDIIKQNIDLFTTKITKDVILDKLPSKVGLDNE